MNHGSLFSGIGGFDLSAERMGWNNIFHCEWNEFGQKILKYYWPKAISYEDITKTDFTPHRGAIDILTGGFPCQPYSTAGKRLGKEDDRHLWPEMLRAIREIQPSWVVGENVRGLINWSGGLVFEEVQADLEAEGYKVQPFLLPACGVGAPHRRDRIWFVAYSNGCDDKGEYELGRYPEKKEGNKTEKPEFRKWLWDEPSNTSKTRDVANSKNSDKQRQMVCKKPHERKVGRCHPSSTGFDKFPTQSPVCHGNDGFPAQLDGITFPKWRTESIKGGGNAIVPQVALQIFKTIEEYKRKHTK